jgi:hypothetical protein
VSDRYFYDGEERMFGRERDPSDEGEELLDEDGNPMGVELTTDEVLNLLNAYDRLTPLAARFAALPETLQEWVVGTEREIVLGLRVERCVRYRWNPNRSVVVCGRQEVTLGTAQTGLEAAELIAKHMAEREVAE